MLASLKHPEDSLETLDPHELQNFTKQNEFCCNPCNKITYVNICSSNKPKSNSSGNRAAKYNRKKILTLRCSRW